MLESLPERMRGVQQFMELFKPSLVYEIVPIHDVYGPTATDPNIQALVVSKETASGGRAGECLNGSRCIGCGCSCLLLKWTNAGGRRACQD